MSTQSMALSQEQKEARLSERELNAYRAYMRLGQPSLAFSTQLQLFQLFLNDLSLEEIVALNKEKGFSLGQLARARVEYNWDSLLDEHRARLMERIREKTQQAQLETVERLINEVVASNKLNNPKVLRYLQNGNEAELEGTGVNGKLGHLKTCLELILKLTGQEASPRGAARPLGAFVSQPPTASPELPVTQAARPLGPSTAAQTLEVILKSRQGK